MRREFRMSSSLYPFCLKDLLHLRKNLSPPSFAIGEDFQSEDQTGTDEFMIVKLAR